MKERTAIPIDEWDKLIEQSQEDLRELDDRLTVMDINGHKLIVAAQDEEQIRDHLDDINLPHLANWLQYYGPVSTRFIAAKTGIPEADLEPLLKNLFEERFIIRGQLILDDEGEYWCDADNYEILLRLVRHQARVSFEPREISELTPFLFNWQTRFKNKDTSEQLFETVENLRCYPAEAGSWERELLPARIRNYRNDQLDLLFQEGNLYWTGSEGSHINFTFREDLDLIGEVTESSGDDVSELFPDEYSRYDFGTLIDRLRDASSEGSEYRASNLAESLWSLVWQGEISNDSMGALRKGIESKFRTNELSNSLKQRETRRSRRSGFNQWRNTIPFSGNWFRLPKPDKPRDLLEEEELKKDRVRVLLDRYGIVFRELLQHELPVLQWRNIFRSLRLMELSGEVFSGYFFSDITGPQFISPEGLRFLQSDDSNEIFWINATDPASSCGMSLLNLRNVLPRRLNSNHLTYHGNELVMVTSRNGKSLDIRVPADHPDLEMYFGCLQHLLYRSFQPVKKVTIESINDIPARKSPYLPRLENSFEVVSDYKSIYLQRDLGI